MHNMPIDFLVACTGIFAVLQALSILLAGLDTAAKQIEGRSTWIARDGTVFEEFSVSEIDGSQVLLHDFEVSRGEAVLAAPMKLQSPA